MYNDLGDVEGFYTSGSFDGIFCFPRWEGIAASSSKSIDGDVGFHLPHWERVAGCKCRDTFTENFNRICKRKDTNTSDGSWTVLETASAEAFTAYRRWFDI